MSKQTVEEAAKDWDTQQFGAVTNGTKIELTENKHSQFLCAAFLAGSAWHKQQGIEWISVEDGSRKPELSVLYLVYDPKDIIKVYPAFYMPMPTIEFAGCFMKGGVPCFYVTHYALINLPKTDE
jgi:hypothetical protein